MIKTLQKCGAAHFLDATMKLSYDQNDDQVNLFAEADGLDSIILLFSIRKLLCVVSDP